MGEATPGSGMLAVAGISAVGRGDDGNAGCCLGGVCGGGNGLAVGLGAIWGALSRMGVGPLAFFSSLIGGRMLTVGFSAFGVGVSVIFLAGIFSSAAVVGIFSSLAGAVSLSVGSSPSSAWGAGSVGAGEIGVGDIGAGKIGAGEICTGDPAVSALMFPV